MTPSRQRPVTLGRTDSVRSTTLHSDDDITRHIFSNVVQHKNPEEARLAVGVSFKKARQLEEGDHTRGHAVFGPGANIKSTNEFLEEPPELESIRREGILQKRVVGKEISWNDRFITLTTEKIYIRNHSEGDIK